MITISVFVGLFIVFVGFLGLVITSFFMFLDWFKMKLRRKNDD